MVSTTTKTADIVIATFTMPDGTSHTTPLSAKTFSTGRQGYFAQISPIVYDGKIFGGQIQMWNKAKLADQ